MSDLRTLAVALGGEVTGRQILAPGPGHSRSDRSLSVRLSRDAPGGFTVFSHAGDDFAACRDHVAAALGLPSDFWRTRGQGEAPARPAIYVAPHDAGPDASQAARIARAVAIWDEAVPAQGTVVERYLTTRGLELPVGAEALRFHPRCAWRNEAAGATMFVPAMVAAMRAIDGDHVTAIHRTRLSPDGVKLDRRMLGIAAGAAVKLDGDAEVTQGLAIGEGVETCLAARQLGFRPVWALASAGAIASFPALGGVEALTIFQENDDASHHAVSTVAERWWHAGRGVTVVTPLVGSDMNDALRESA